MIVKSNRYLHLKYIRKNQILAMVGILFPLWGHILNYLLPDVNDPLLYRYLMTAFLTLIILYEYKNKFVEKKYFAYLFFLTTQFLNCYVFWVTANSLNHQYYIFGNFLAVSFIGQFYDSFKEVWIHSILSLISFIYFNAMIEGSLTPPLMQGLLYISSFMIILINLVDKTSLEKKLLLSKKLIDEQEKKLDVARAKSFEMSKLKSLAVMASGIAHEVNNPLMIISGNANKLIRRSDKDLSKEILQKIVISTTRISDIMQNLKIISDDKTSIKVKNSNAEEIFELSLMVLHSKFKKYNIHFTKKDLSNNENLFCCPKSIATILTHFLSNAIDAVKDQPLPAIELSLKIEHEKVIFSVFDNGHQIDQTILESIMEPFVSNKATGNGAGLGLSISKSLALEHDGQITIKEEKKGKSFILTFAHIQFKTSKKAA